MIDDAIGTFLSSQRSRPLSVAVAIFALFVPSSLIIFLSKPTLFMALGTNGVILLSVCISLPIVMICFGIWWTPLNTIRDLQRISRQGPPQVSDLQTSVIAADPLEWPCLLTGAWTANLILFVVAALSYFRPLRIGATFLLLAILLVGLWIIVFALSMSLHISLSRKLKVANSSDHVAAS
jgi:hypothetical protein